MGEQGASYRPEIEDAMATSGEDIGRVKDMDIAHDVAIEMNAVRNMHERMADNGLPVSGTDMDAEREDMYVKGTIAEKAVKKTSVVHNIVAQGLNPEGPSYLDDTVNGAVEQVKAIGADYDKLQKEAGHVRTAKELEEARRKIKELEGK